MLEAACLPQMIFSGKLTQTLTTAHPDIMVLSSQENKL